VSQVSEANWLLQVRRHPLPLLDREQPKWVTIAHPVTLLEGVDAVERETERGHDARLLLHGEVYYYAQASSPVAVRLLVPGVTR
jgi:hypothetical protein